MTKDIYLKTLYANSERLLQYADDRGIEFPYWMKEGSRIAEAFSRWCLERALEKFYPKSVFTQGAGYSNYDATWKDTIYYEHKFRLFENDHIFYDRQTREPEFTDKVSEKKENMEFCQGNPSWFVFTFSDGVVRMYNFTASTYTEEWTHSSETAEDNGKGDVTELCLAYERDEAYKTTEITLPPFKGREWTKEEFRW